MLRSLISGRTADAIELTSGITVEVRSASFRRLRGPTYAAVICDEAAFWFSDEFSANADIEILNAVRPGLATTRGPLIIASSPYARRGEVWEAFRKNYGAEGDRLVLVVKGASRTFNPSLPQSIVDRALERDRAAASAEFLAEFRTDIETFVACEIVQACVGGHIEMAPVSDVRYRAFCDPSGGSSDSFTLAIAHREGDRIVVDCVRERRPPFSPEAVIEEFCGLLEGYRVNRVMGDKYAGEFPREQFRKRGIAYKVCDKAKSDLYVDLLPLLNSGRITLPKSDRLVNQLCGLERRVSRAGRDSIDHARGAHDDLANCIGGAAHVIADAERNTTPMAQYGTYATVVPVEPRRPSRFDGAVTIIAVDGKTAGTGWATSR